MASLTKKRNSIPSLPPISPTNDQSNLNNILVITKNDLDRIHGHLNKNRSEIEACNEEAQRKKELHEKSLALTRNWNNTIEGSRRHKLQQKTIREAKNEAERQAVDIEFAKVMAVERKAALEQAKLKQYHETDKVKSFHSAMKLSEVLKEREAQIELKKLIDEIKLEQEREIAAQFQQIQSAKDIKEVEKYRKKQIEVDQLREFQKKQVQRKEEIKERHKEEVLHEGEIIAQLNEQYRFEKEQLQKIRKQQQKDLRGEYDRTLENKLRNQEAAAIIDEEENDEIRVYANAKKKMAIMKRQKELAILKEKEEQKERLISKIGVQLKEKDNDEDFRIAKDLAKKEAKEYNEEIRKNLKYEQDMHKIHLHRKETMQRKAEEKKQQEKEDEEFMKKKMETDLLYQMYEREKQNKRQQDMNDIQKNNSKLIKNRKEKAEKERFLEKEYIAKEMELMKHEDKQFEEYTTNVIGYMEKHGRNTYPMKKVVYNQLHRGTNPVETEAEMIKKHQNDVKSKKNLGFM